MLKNSFCSLIRRKRERIGRFFFALIIQLKQQGVRNDTSSSESTVSVIGRLSIWELWHSNLQQGRKENIETNLNCLPNFESPPLLTEVQMISKGSFWWGCQNRCNIKEAGNAYWITTSISVIASSIQIKVLCFVHQDVFWNKNKSLKQIRKVFISIPWK